MKKILFVCTGNSCRSVMAEGLFKKLAAHAKDYYVASAGVSAMDGYPPTFETIQVMRDQEGVDVSDHLSQRATPDMVRSYDKIFVMQNIHKEILLRMAPEAEGKVFCLTDFASKNSLWDKETGIPDPIRMPDQFYKNVLGLIKDCVTNLVEKLESKG